MNQSISRKRHNKAKLDDGDIPIIRTLISDGLSCSEIGKKFDVSRQTIYRIKTNKLWKHIQ